MRVLLVDGEEHLVTAIRWALQAEGIFVDTAADGAEGLFKAQEGCYAVVILATRASGKEDYEICQQLREAQVWTPLLVLTRQGNEAEETFALNLGADDFLLRPFSFPVLVARVRALARRGGGPTPTTMRVGDLELDPIRRRCARAGSSIGLTEKEFALLEFFMRRPGEVLSKQQILDYVWGFDFDGYLNIVEVYISYLRRKVDEPFGRQSIQTVRGAGYRLRQGSCDQ